jgi:hypothetical protein
MKSVIIRYEAIQKSCAMDCFVPRNDGHEVIDNKSFTKSVIINIRFVPKLKAK